MKRGNLISSNTRGQVTVFIIAALVIVGLAVLIYFLRPGAKVGSNFDEENPHGFIQSCIQDRIEEVVAILSEQGGSIVPDSYSLYQDQKIEYLCYTSENYLGCSIQRPFLKKHIEEEIQREIQNEVRDCFSELRIDYEARGFQATLIGNGTRVELLPNRIVTNFDYNLTATKQETERYNDFNVVLNNNLYELTSIANSIVDYEALYGDADTSLYMTLYPELKVEKVLRDDGTKIYILTDRERENKFQFASRSGVIPSGYGYNNVATN